MERVDLHVPAPMKEEIEEFRSYMGYDHRSEAMRELLRRGLNNA